MSLDTKPARDAAGPAAASATRFQYFAVTAPGLESLLARELTAMGVDARIVRGGVEGKLTQTELWNVHLRSTLAESVRIRLKAFEALDFLTLQRGLERLPWHAYMRRGDAFSVKVTCHKSRLFHSDAVAERVHNAIARVWNRSAPQPDAHSGGRRPTVRAVDEALPSSESDASAQQIFVRLMRDEVTTSIDASGERLHRRGYRTHVEKAPLRETLAAAMVRLLAELGGDPTTLCDPFCGSGVLPLEWLRWRAGDLPGADRTFAFEQWPIHATAAWEKFRAEAIAACDAAPQGISHAVCADIDTKALSSARNNAISAGHERNVQFVLGDFKKTLKALPGAAAILTNPPYGVRLGTQKQAQTLYLDLDRVLSERVDLRPVVITCVDPAFQKRARLPWRKLAETEQGGLHLSLLGLE